MDISKIEAGSRTSSYSTASENEYERWKHWPVNWTAVFVGTLAALAMTMLFALAAVALGAHQLTPQNRVVDLHKIGKSVMILGIFGSFFSFVVGGWVTGKIAGILHSEPAILHGSITWLTALPLLALLSSVGVGGYAGSWYGGLGNRGSAIESPYTRPEALTGSATEQQRAAYDAEWAAYRRDVAAWNADTPRATRNGALFAVTALLIGLMGSVVGGWMSCGEPMSVRYKRPALRNA